ncbi:MAG: hypothetical protein JW734_05820 [Candidatus Omnitrophica bacterium]|nr:hypothetical protein [Candidatus Omnitrophota bacterium]
MLRLILVSLFMFCIVFGIPADNGEAVKPPSLCVKGIMFDKEKPLAVINGQVKGLGAVIDGAEIKEITESKVTFDYQGSVFTRKLGQDCGPAVPSGSVAPSVSSRSRISRDAAFGKFKGMHSRGEFPPYFAAILGLMWLAWLILYIYIATALQVIANKTSTSNAWFAWIPILNLYLMCQISGKSGWFLLLLFIPFVNIIVIIYIWMGIAQARGKPSWLGVLMLLPLVNIIIPGYLAFSK